MNETGPNPDDRDAPAETLTRRDMLDRMLLAGGVIWTAGVAVPAALYVWPAGSRGPGQEFGDAGSTKDFAVGSARMVHMRGKPVMVLHLKPGQFRAFSAVCTHLGCIVRWDPKDRLIRCPCHAGVFAPDGTVASGPPPRPLHEYRIVVVGENVRVYA